MCVCVKYGVSYHPKKMGIRTQDNVEHVWC